MNPKPLVSFVLFSYNQDKYIEEAIEGALNQSYEPMEIIISDDCSSDKTFELIEHKVSNSRKKIIINRNDHNLGIARHFNKLMMMASGELVVVAAGDDISLPNRAQRLVEKWEEGGRKADIVFSSRFDLDQTGAQNLNRSERFVVGMDAESVAMGRGQARGCTCSYSKRMINMYDPLSQNIIYEDSVTNLRAAMAGGHAYVDEPLVIYRTDTSNWMGRKDNNFPLYTYNSTKQEVACLSQLVQDSVVVENWSVTYILCKRILSSVLLRRSFKSISRGVKGSLEFVMSGGNIRTYIKIMLDIK